MRSISKNIVVCLALLGTAGWMSAAPVLQVDPDFDAQLVASEGLGGIPSDLDWDPKGRPWVTVTASEAPGIYLLEDSDGDGVYDHRRAFYRKAATSMVFHGGGMLAVVDSRIVFIDSKGLEQPLFSGFAGPGGIAELRLECRGLDGWVYGVIRYLAGLPQQVMARGGKVLDPIDGGIFRLRPDGSAMESVSSIRGRVQGLDFSWDGELFFSGDAHLNQLILPDAQLREGRVKGATGTRVLGDYRRSYPDLQTGRVHLQGVMQGAGGCVVYGGGAWPEQFHGNYFVAEPALHSVHENIISVLEGRTEYSAVRRTTGDFVKGDSSFWPTDLKVGPDGALYILDTYAPVREHGRIWRVNHKRARKLPMPGFESEGDSGLIRALGHPNRWARMTAQRLLEARKGKVSLNTVRSVSSTSRLAPFRVHALWALNGLGGSTSEILLKGVQHYHWGVQKNSLRILAERSDLITSDVEDEVGKLLASHSRRVRMRAVAVLAQTSLGDDVIKDVTDYFKGERQEWGRSLAVGVVRQAPLEIGKRAFKSDKPDDYRDLMPILVEAMVVAGREDDLAQLIIAAADASSRKDRLKRSLMRAINPYLGKGFTPTWSKEFGKAMEDILDTNSRTLLVAALPLAFHYPSEEDLIEEAGKALEEVLDRLKEDDVEDDYRGELLAGLMHVWRLESRMISRMGTLLESKAKSDVKEQAIRDLSNLSSDEAGGVMITVYPELKAELQELIVQSLLTRKNWTRALLQAIDERRINGRQLGLGGLDRLRHHPDESVSRVGNILYRDRMKPVPGNADLLLSRFEPVLKSPADVDEGEDAFDAHCASCHNRSSRGESVGPRLLSLEKRDSTEVLAHVLDPNRSVSERYKAHQIQTKTGDSYHGVIAHADRQRIVVEDTRGSTEVLRSEVQGIRTTNRSYMPEGFGVLGAKTLRDIIGYLRSQPSKEFRLVDLAPLATVDSRRGLYHPLTPIFDFERFGVVEVSGEPYRLLDPVQISGGKNVLMLKGGQGFAKSFPKRVEIPVNAAVKELFFLSGVAAWGFPYGTPEQHDVPALRVVMRYADGTEEEQVYRNRESFADVGSVVEVPETKLVEDLLYQGHLRRFSIETDDDKKLAEVVLESYDNHLAPVVVALTIELED